MSRILKISVALAVLGALAGAIGGCLALAVMVMIYGPHATGEVTLSDVAGIIAALGGGCGVFVAPVLSWTLLRDVPIWRCATETALATSFAGLLAVNFTNADPWKTLAISVLAAAFAAARLRWAFRRRTAKPEVPA